MVVGWVDFEIKSRERGWVVGHGQWLVKGKLRWGVATGAMHG
jgi:hypothetical protein